MSSTEPRTRNRPGEGERLRADIVNAADALLAEAGSSDRLSLRGIARSVGITAPAIYAHFATKDELLAAVLERRFGWLADALRAAEPGGAGGADAGGAGRAGESRDEESGAAIETVRARARAYVRFGLEHPAHYAALFGPTADHLGLAYAGSPGEAVFAEVLMPVAAVLAERGSSDNPLDRATDVWVALHGLVALRSTQPSFVWGELEAQIDRLVDRLLA